MNDEGGIVLQKHIATSGYKSLDTHNYMYIHKHIINE
jgi:hypothetical protein